VQSGCKDKLTVRAAYKRRDVRSRKKGGGIEA
jgi:hypothetical protein